ncbi:MAG: cbb3-type cytochrome c oxidase subunit 3 [Emcibacter sp.]|nr:cbb3-type cytochrome c oxidase subunit 3 [Emcibacter sp.]MBL4894679.1 cbb3-type cytochrome c oxidase subunit 3 [Emcibacter sp.]
MTHQDVANFSESWGLLFLFSMFVVAIAYAFWPSNGKKFTDAGHRPLDEE